MVVEESSNMIFYESNPILKKKDSSKIDFEQIFSKEETSEIIINEQDVETQIDHHGKTSNDGD